MEKITENRPILIIANSSWYLAHYRSRLVMRLKELGAQPICMAPMDKFSVRLEKLGIFIPWRVYRNSAGQPLALAIGLAKMMFILRALKPSIVHSHTLLANLITSIVCAAYGIPCVLSFAGLGRLRKSNKFKHKAELYILIKTISLFSRLQRIKRFAITSNSNRTAYIFQNPEDLDFVSSYLSQSSNVKTEVIQGSGVPDYYDRGLVKTTCLSIKAHSKGYLDGTETLNVIYCARLLKSKGILRFVELAKAMPSINFVVYGSVDKSCSDTLTESEVLRIDNAIKNISFKGSIIDPLLNHNKNSILVIPSNYGEGFPRAAAEAMILGIPVIVSKTASVSLINESMATLVSDTSIYGYKDAVTEYIKDPQTSYEKITKAYYHAKNNWLESQIVDKTVRLYTELASTRHDNYLQSKVDSERSTWCAS